MLRDDHAWPHLCQLALPALIAILMMAAVACGAPDERFPALSNIGLGPGVMADPSVEESCDDGDTRDCLVMLGVQGSVVECFEGIQTCVDGEWGSCADSAAQSAPGPR